MTDAPRQTLPKPPFGEPCNGCGLCCIVRVCATGAATLGLVSTFGDRVDGPCPVLTEEPGGGFSCGLVARPRDHAPAGRGGAHDLRRAVKVMIGAGAGCDEADDGTSDAELRDFQQRYVDRVGRERIQAAVKTWFGG